MTSLAENDEHISEEVRERCRDHCRRFLAGSWITASPSDFQIRQIKGGLSNLLYCCQLSDVVPLVGNEPRCALVRFFGDIVRDNSELVLTGSVIFGLLAAKKIGPDIYGIFMDGRLEEYIPSRNLHTKELHDPAISEACAEIMAQFHTLRMPIDKNPKWILNLVTDFTNESIERLASDKTKEEKLDRLRSIDLLQEHDSIMSTLEKMNSPVVFCHNDLQPGNILYVKTPTGCRLRPIDFEYAGYNYRGYDFASHMSEWCFNYEHDEPPYFEARPQDFPNREQQLHFVRAYLKAIDKENRNGHNSNQTRESHSDDAIVCSDEEEKVLLEISAFSLLASFSGVVWSIVQHYKSDIPFGYLDFAIARWNAYTQRKQHFCQKLANKLPNERVVEFSTSL